MKITGQNIDSFFSKSLGTAEAILLYGENKGLRDYRFEKICNNFLGINYSPWTIIEFDFDYIKSNLNIIATELKSLSFMVNRKIIKVVNSQNTLNRDFAELINKSYRDNLIIFIADELQSNSSLRKFFENSAKGASIACYNFEKLNIIEFAKRAFSNDDYNISKSALELLSQKLTGDQYIIEAEINKIKLYKKNDKNIDVEDVEKVCIDLEEYTIDEFCNAIITRHISAFAIYQILSQQKIEYILIIRSLYKSFIKLLTLRIAIEQGCDIANSISTLSPKLFYKQIPIFTKAATIWKSFQIIEIISNLRNIELSYKTNNIVAYAIFNRFIIDIIDFS